MNSKKPNLYYATNNIKILDVKITDYDWQIILDFIYLLPLHSYIFDTIWVLEVLTYWLFGITLKTENVVKTDKRIRTENMVIMKEIANEHKKYKSHKYNVHFILDSDDDCRKYYEHALKTSYSTYSRLKHSTNRQVIDVYCIFTREPQCTLYYPTEKTIPEKYKRMLGDIK